jgi:hypothetical protein
MTTITSSEATTLRQFLSAEGIDTDTRSHDVFARDNQLLVLEINGNGGWGFEKIQQYPTFTLADWQGLEDGHYIIWRADHTEEACAKSDVSIVDGQGLP